MAGTIAEQASAFDEVYLTIEGYPVDVDRVTKTMSARRGTFIRFGYLIKYGLSSGVQKKHRLLCLRVCRP